MSKKSPSDNGSIRNFEFYIKYERPEETAKDPLVFYTDSTVKEYASSKAIMGIQEKITKRALEITQLSPPARVLDLGTGCGFASLFLYLKKYRVIGIDICRPFLTFYHTPDINLLESDMRVLGFRDARFDLIISISAVQWILAEEIEKRRKKWLNDLANNCARLLRDDGQIIFQFYPKSDEKMHELGSAFNQTGQFTGGFLIDNPDSPKKRRIFLHLHKKSQK
jgi:SAM-dependent methyltransferase